MPASPVRTLDELYGTGFEDDLAFEEALGQSLDPRGYGLLFDVVAQLGLAPGSRVLDVGCREAFHCLELARRFKFTVRGVDPMRSHLDRAERTLNTLRQKAPEIAARVELVEGFAEQLPEPDGTYDLVWCRDVLEHVQDLKAVFREFHRVLRPGGHVVVFQVTATEWLTPDEAARLWPPLGAYATSMEPAHIEAAISASGLGIDQCVELHGEWREYAEETGRHRTSEQLLRVSRLLRNKAAYQERFGSDAYETTLSNNLWGIYQMIGKLNPRVYVLSR